MTQYKSPDGTNWTVTVRLPGFSHAMIVFLHPDGGTARRDRYNWLQSDTPEARNVTSRLDPGAVARSLTEQQLARLFRRSMLISAADNPLSTPVTQSA